MILGSGIYEILVINNVPIETRGKDFETTNKNCDCEANEIGHSL